MAAAVTLGIFFIGTSDNNSKLININSAETLVADNTAPVSSETMVEPQAVEAATPALKATARQLRAVAAPKARTVAEEPVATQPVAESTQPVATQPAAQPSAAQPASKPSKTVAEPEQAESDPFAQMEFEDSRANRRNTNLSLLLTGGASGNNAAAGRLAQAAPGSYLQNGITETSKSTYGIPVIVGVGARLDLTNAISIGAGVDYALLTRSFEGTYNGGSGLVSGDFNHTLQYIGVPVDLFVTLVERKDIKLYSNVGAEVEKAISNKYRLLGTDTVVGDKVKGMQWSVGGGIGIEFSLGERLALFAEPTFKYYFNCDQPKSVRTEKPFQMVLRAGVRFDI